MGLTIHYTFKHDAQENSARPVLEQLRQAALDLPFKEVTELVELKGDQCDYQKREQGDPARWLLIQAGGSVSLGGHSSLSVAPTGMKFIDLNKHECVLVLSKNSVVAWSKQQGRRSGLRIEKGMKLHPDSLAHHVTPPAGEAGPEVVNPEAWISQNAYARQIEVTEQSWALEGYNSALTLLVIADVDGAEDDDLVRHYELKNSRSA